MAGRTISGTALAELASASSAALVQPASSAERAWPSNSANLMRPGNSAERARPGSSAALLRLAGSAGLVRPASGADEAGAHRILPVLPELSRLLPDHGLRRGSTVAVATGPSAPASGGTSLLLALLAAASRAGSWCAVVGVPELGALAAAESGIALDRLALVPNPGPEWPTVVAALIDGVDVVVTAVPGPVSASIAGRLAARARQRGSVLVPFGRWDGADVTLQVVRGRWDGLGAGHGRLRRREVTIAAHGRGAAARPREITVWMPGLVSPDERDLGVVVGTKADRARIRAATTPRSREGRGR